MRAICALLGIASLLAAQRSDDPGVRTPAGLLASRQAMRDAAADSLVLLVASHPDDRYVLPAVWLRFAHGLRVSVLIASRGGGGQNSMGSETGDALERIRTLETEAGCAQFGADVWYLNRPDGGYRRSADETFAEWGRDATLRDLVRLLRTIRPDAIVTTHNKEEQHGHDLALVELLPEAIRLAADRQCDVPGEPHAVRAFLLGGGSTPSPHCLNVDVDQLDRDRGATWRRLAHDVLRSAHVSPGPPLPIDDVFDAVMSLEPQPPTVIPIPADRPLGLPTVFDVGTWPGDPVRGSAIDAFLRTELPERVARGDHAADAITAVLRELGALRDGTSHADVRARLARRIAACEQLLLLTAGLQLEIEVPPGTMAVAGEEFVATVRLHTAKPVRVDVRAEGLDGVEVELVALDENNGSNGGPWSRANAIIRIPLTQASSEEAMAARFRSDRFVPPVRLRFHVRLGTVEVPVVTTVPVEQRAPVELHVVPGMLLLPSARQAVQFSVGVVRNSQFPIEAELEVRGPAGYAIPNDRRNVVLREPRHDLFAFDVSAPSERKAGVDVLRIRLGATRIALPVHKVDVQVPAGLRVGILRSRDTTLPSVLGVGGLGIHWSELSDADVAAADLRDFHTIAVDIRALRDRPGARSGFRRLLEFAEGKGKRLVLFYQKDVEFHPEGESFLGAPYAPFQIGKNRVTRADAPVHVLRPDHVLLNRPNVIRPGDWDGWEQERGLYLPSVYASQFEELIEIGDPGQPIERGALLYARKGDGEYVYCALSLWRQLKKLHPGAVRLLANLMTPSGAR